MDSKRRPIELDRERVIPLSKSWDHDVCSKSPKKLKYYRRIISSSGESKSCKIAVKSGRHKGIKKRERKCLESDDRGDEGTSQGNAYRRSGNRIRHPKNRPRDDNRKLISSSDEQSDDEDGDQGTPQGNVCRRSRKRRIYHKSRSRDKNRKNRKLISSSDEQSDYEDGEGTLQRNADHTRSCRKRQYSRGRSHSSTRAEYTQASKKINSESVIGMIFANSRTTVESNARSNSRSSTSHDDSSYNSDEYSDESSSSNSTESSSSNLSDDDSSFSSEEFIVSDDESSCSDFNTDKKSERTVYPGMRKIVQGAFTAKGISKEPAKTMMKSLSDRTLRQYKKPLHEWWKYCKQKKISLYEFNSIAILDFFQLKNDLKYYEIKIYRAALSLIMENKPGKDPDINRFVKAVAKVEDNDEKLHLTYTNN